MEAECCALAGTDCRPTPLRRRAGRPQLKRDPLDGTMSSEVNSVSCKRHGPQPETFVCQHIVQSLHDRRPVGFFWSSETPSARPDAWCSACNQRVAATGGEWTPEAEAEAEAGVTVLCGACYDEAKSLAGF